MNGNLEPEERVLNRNTWQEQIEQQLINLGWEEDDEILVEVGGTVVSGIHQPPDANPKWTLPFGKRRYNKDAFLIISNASRRETVRSQPLSDEQLSKGFHYGSNGQLYKTRELEELPESPRVDPPRLNTWSQITNWVRNTLSK